MLTIIVFAIIVYYKLWSDNNRHNPTYEIPVVINPTMDKQAVFPRLGGYNIGSPQNYDEEEYQKQLAKRDLIILGMYNGWNKNGKTPLQVIKEIKIKNPNILIGNYTLMTEIPDAWESNVVYRNKLNTEKGPNGTGNWWAYNSAGKQTDWSNGAWGTHDVNITSFVTPDANGDRWSEWLAKKNYELLFKNVGFDFYFFDNNFWKPRSNADWNRDGKNDDQNDVIVQGWWRAGQRAHYEQLSKISPNLYRVANVDGDLSGNFFPEESQPYNEYKNILHGALMEHIIGKNWSVESWGGWKMMMVRYYELFNNLLEPKMVIFEVYGRSNDYQTFRYAFTSSLMNDGYFTYSIDENYTSYKPLAWFDEYDLAGTSNTKWLGKTIDNPPTKAWQNGVYMRKFENGMAIVNPKGNGSQTIKIERGYKRILGKQDAVINNGQIADTITLKDRDGIILIKSK